LIACKVEPEPLEFGKDACNACRMTLMDNKFGGEILTAKGKIYKFDDVNCMIIFYKSGLTPSEEVKDVLIVDFSNPSQLIDAKKAYYVRSDAINSPMGSSIAAFRSMDDLATLNTGWNGIQLSWEELQK
jgi:copper chaperone NosL